MRKTTRFIAVLALPCLSLIACQKKADTPSSEKPLEPAVPVPRDQIKSVSRDLGQWVKPSKLSKAERNAFDGFCAFLAARRYCDYEIEHGRMTNEEAVAATQPLIDDLASRGEAAENVLLQLLTARKDLDSDKRRETYCGEDPEVFATVVLWKLKSEKAVPIFIESARNMQFANRAVFVRGLARIGHESAIPFLRELAQTEKNKEIKREALMGLASNPKVEKRGVYVQVLINIADNEVLRFLRELAVNDTDPVIRKQAEAAVKILDERIKIQQSMTPTLSPAIQPLRPRTTTATAPIRAVPTTPTTKGKN